MAKEVVGVRRTVGGVEAIECPECKTDYNRARVIEEIKKQSPFLTDFAMSTTKFVCQICGAQIIITF